MFKPTAKRRRTKQEIKDQEQAEAARKLEIEQKMAKFDEMEKKMNEIQAQLQNQQKVEQTASALFE